MQLRRRIILNYISKHQAILAGRFDLSINTLCKQELFCARLRNENSKLINKNGFHFFHLSSETNDGSLIFPHK